MHPIFRFFILFLFSLFHTPAIGLTDYFKVGQSIDENNHTIDIIIDTSFNLDQFVIKDNLLTGYEAAGVDTSTGKEIFTPQEDILRIPQQNKFKVSGAGIHQIFIQNKETLEIVWEQWVYVPYPKPFKDKDLDLAAKKNRLLAEKYLPITVYADNEAYFPQDINDILNISNKPIFISMPSTNGDEAVNMGEDLIRFLSEKGNAQFILHPNPTFDDRFSLECDASTELCRSKKHPLRNSTGQLRPLTVYYTLAEIDQKVYLSYHYIYAFDMKTGSKNKPNLGAHIFDRENLTLVLIKEDDQWIPESITYGAHLPSIEGLEDAADILFTGCSKHILTDCRLRGDIALAQIKIGKTQLNWQDVPTLGNHPIVYVAQGSHALYPAYGHYVIPILFIDELAGNNSDKYTFYPQDYQLKELDTNQPSTRSFLYSGFWVADILGVNNSRFPPFIRLPPFWTVDASTAFSQCMTLDKDQDSSCNAYFPNQPVGIQQHAAITGRITNIPNNKTVKVSYGGSTYYETETDLEGNFSLIIPTNLTTIPSGLLITQEHNLRMIKHQKNGSVDLDIKSTMTKNIGEFNYQTLEMVAPQVCPIPEASL